MKEDKTRINVVLPNPLLNGAKHIAKTRGTSYSEIIRTALRQYVLAELKKEKESE